MLTAINKLFQTQKENWPLAAANYAGLQQALQKEFLFEGFEIKVQFNPERIRSSLAPTDNRSVLQGRCILCVENRPSEQQGIDYQTYHILVNPYPIFPQHLTIADKRHVPQRIENRISDMLDLARILPEYVIVYNGPECGASVPSHFHFQAGNKGFLPVEKEIHSFAGKTSLKREAEGSVYYMSHYLRKCFVYESSSEKWLIEQFNWLVEGLQHIQSTEKEPLFNIICWKEETGWQWIVFPRKQHRPRQYHETGGQQILLSPGVVDFGGVWIVPRKTDYDKIDKELLIDIYSQLTLSDEAARNLCRHIVDQ
ncbi:MAG: DUF4922 domain-containing protein [Candidatus Azobacteroides sp.]|nr:DUF4922 domain-containing protein [Candidatus Azobacteroides sp.]